METSGQENSLEEAFGDAEEVSPLNTDEIATYENMDNNDDF